MLKKIKRVDNIIKQITARRKREVIGLLFK